MTTQPPPPLTRPREPLDSDGRLDGNLPCRRCGYNLRGQLTEAACPECGAPVAASLRYFLRYCSYRWVRELASGADAIGLALLVVLGTWAAMAAAAWLPGPVLPWAFGMAAGIVGLLGVLVLVVLGLWLLTKPESPRRGREAGRMDGAARRAWWIRVLLRWSPAATLLLVAAWSVATAEWVAARRPVELVGVALTALGGVVMLALLCLHLGGLMRRIPNRELVRVAYVAVVATALSGVLLVVGAGLLWWGVGLAGGRTFSEGEVRWRLGGAISPAGGGVPLATIETEMLPGTRTGPPPQPGTVTVWVASTFSVPSVMALMLAAPPGLAVVGGVALLIFSRRALREAADLAQGGG